MASSDLTFLTNEPGNTLRDRFGDLLNQKAAAFDCLVGYFYKSGFAKLHPLLEEVGKVRILIGLRTDYKTYQRIQHAKELGEVPLNSHAETQERAAKDALTELEKAPDDAETEKGVHKFVDWIRSGKLEIRAHASENLHAKVYIITFAEGDRDAGRVITGSSNFTQAGLVDNLEFNVELKNRADYEFALAKFNELWKIAVDVREPYIDTITNRSPYAPFTPYELYLKFLYEYFREEINRLPKEEAFVPPGFKRLKYQEEAVLNAMKVLEEYGGVFLADVVDLGKTYMSALLAQQLDGRHLVIAPPHLLDPNKKGSWPDVFEAFQVRQTHFESIGKLDNVLNGDHTVYKNVFIDESHRFRTETTQSYEALAQICRGKRVILISATPLNNSPEDILAQVKLFQSGRRSTIPNLPNLEAFFAGLRKRLHNVDRQRDREKYLSIVAQNAKETRERVLKYLMIRRTRSEIERYYGEDIHQQGFRFPEVHDPRPLYYKLSKTENVHFNETVRLLGNCFKYARYQPLLYYKGEWPEQELQSQRNLARFMSILLVKRLESSFQAFQLTVGRFITAYYRVIRAFNDGFVYISRDYSTDLFDALERGDFEAVESFLEEGKAERLPAADFRPDFLTDLQSDLHVLEEIEKRWISITRDPKWEAFKKTLQSDPELKQGKIIIFTESKETATYLTTKISKEVEPRVLCVTGLDNASVHRKVLDNFDANAFHKRDEYRILVSTEVLSEGVNLHRSNTVINYDIPWNPTRLIQRVGRVNRVDTKFDAIHTYTFFPTEESNDLIKLEEAAKAKIQAFIEMLGADARLLTDGEEIKSHDLFARLTSKKTITGEDEDEESELEYLAELRDVRDKNPELFSRIKRLPKKARSTRLVRPAPDAPLPALLTYFRKGRLDKFYRADQEGESATELDFFAAVKALKPLDPDEKRQQIGPEFYPLLERNKAAFEAATDTSSDDGPQRRGKHEGYILKRLKARDIRTWHGFSEEEEQFIRRTVQLIQDGDLPKATAKTVAGALEKETDPLRVLAILRRDIPDVLFQRAAGRSDVDRHSPREVILSSYLVEAE